MQQPGLAGRLGIKPEMGLLDVIAGQAALEQTVVKTLVPSLHALPMAQRASDVTLTTEAAGWLLGRMRDARSDPDRRSERGRDRRPVRAGLAAMPCSWWRARPKPSRCRARPC